MIPEQQLKEKLRQAIRESTFSEAPVFDDTLLFQEGILDSMGFLQLIEFLGSEFTVVPNDEDLLEQNFESINAIVAFLHSKWKVSLAA
jgi:acyl carrier protein